MARAGARTDRLHQKRQPRTDRPGNCRTDEAGALQPNLAGHIIRIDEADADCGRSVHGRLPRRRRSRSRHRHRAQGQPAMWRRHSAMGRSIAGTASPIPITSSSIAGIAFDRHRWNPDIFADCNDQVLATPLNAEGPRPLKRFLCRPGGLEICGPPMAPDERVLLRHPASWESDVAGVDFSQTRWGGTRAPSSFPDGGWPRSAVVVVTRSDGGRIGD